jgi:hypothetical protein
MLGVDSITRGTPSSERCNLRFGFKFLSHCSARVRARSPGGGLLEVAKRCGSVWGVEHRMRAALPGIVSILTLACSNTPIDAILPLDAGLEGSGGAPPADCSEPVSAVVPGLYNVILDDTGECLALGDETLIAGTPATGYEATLSADCTQSGALFRIQTTGFQLGFELRNVESNLSLDIEAYETSPGTRAVLYDPTNNSNQRFYISRFPGSLTLFSIAPVYVRGLCLTATSVGEMEIWACEAGSSQAFRLVRSDCE